MSPHMNTRSGTHRPQKATPNYPDHDHNPLSRCLFVIYAISCIAFSCVGVVLLLNYKYYAKFSKSNIFKIGFLLWAVHLLFQGITSFVNDTIFMYDDEIPHRFKHIRSVELCMATCTLLFLMVLMPHVLHINHTHYNKNQYNTFKILFLIMVVARIVSYKHSKPEQLRNTTSDYHTYLIAHTIWHYVPILGGIYLIAK